MAFFFPKLPESWTDTREIIRQIIIRLNKLADPKSYTYAGLKATIIGVDPSAFNDTNETLDLTGSGGGGDTGSDGVIGGGRRYGEDGYIIGGRRYI